MEIWSIKVFNPMIGFSLCVCVRANWLNVLLSWMYLIELKVEHLACEFFGVWVNLINWCSVKIEPLGVNKSTGGGMC